MIFWKTWESRTPEYRSPTGSKSSQAMRTTWRQREQTLSSAQASQQRRRTEWFFSGRLDLPTALTLRTSTRSLEALTRLRYSLKIFLWHKTFRHSWELLLQLAPWLSAVSSFGLGIQVPAQPLMCCLRTASSVLKAKILPFLPQERLLWPTPKLRLRLSSDAYMTWVLSWK